MAQEIGYKLVFDNKEFKVGGNEMLTIANELLKSQTNLNQSLVKLANEGAKSQDKLHDAFDESKKSAMELAKAETDLNKRTKTGIGLFGKATSSLRGWIGQTKAGSIALKVLDTGMKLFGGSLGKLKGVGLAIFGPLGIAIGAVASYLFSTQKGSEQLGEYMGKLKATVEVLTDKFNLFGEAAFNSFQDPQKAISGLWEAIKENIVNRMEGLINLFGALKGAVSAAFSPTKSISEPLEQAGRALIQITTGLDTEQQNKFAEGFTKIKEEINLAAAAGATLNAQMIQLRKDQIALNVATSQQRAEIEELKRDSEDINRTLEERIELSTEAFAKEKALIDEQISLKQREIDLTKQEIALNSDSDKIENLEKVAAIQVELNGLIEQSATKQTELQNKVNALTKESNDKLEALKATYEDLVSELTDKTVEVSLTLGDPEEQLKKQFDLALQAIAGFEKALNEAAKADGVEAVDVSEDIALLKLAAEKEYLTELKKLRTEAANTEFDQNQKLALQQVALIQESGDEELSLEEFKEKEKLKILIEYAKKRLDILPKGSFEFEQLKGDIALFEQELSGIGKDAEPNGIDAFVGKMKEKLASALGLTVGEFDEAVKQAGVVIDSITGSILSGLDAQISKLDEFIDKQDEKISVLQENLDREKGLRDEGLAYNLESLQVELDEQNRLRDEAAIKQQEATKKRQAIQSKLDTASQFSSLITASANIIKGFSPIPIVGTALGIAAVGAMLAFFAKSKIDAANATKNLYTGASNIGEHFGHVDKGGATDLPGRGTSGYGIYQMDGGNPVRDTGVRVGGNEGLVTEKTYRSIGHIIEDIERMPSMAPLLDQAFQSIKSSNLPVKNTANRVSQLVVQNNVGISDKQMERVMRKVLKEQSRDLISHDEQKVTKTFIPDIDGKLIEESKFKKSIKRVRGSKK